MRVLSSPNLLPDLAESAGFVVGRFATLISLNPLSPAGAGSYIPIRPLGRGFPTFLHSPAGAGLLHSCIRPLGRAPTFPFARWGGLLHSHSPAGAGLLRCLTVISVFDAAASRFNSGAGTLGHGKTPGLYRLLNLA